MNKKWEVFAIPFDTTHTWLLNKHYAKRIPSIVYAYGVFVDHVMQGVITYGIPASPSLTMGVCGIEHRDKVVELNRLAILENHDKNLASYFVAQTLKMLPKPLVVVSYADTSMGHVGYIYQATNFLFTGTTKKRTDMAGKDGKHSRHHLGDRTNRINRSAKHRYVYFIGTKKEKKVLRNALRYDINNEYPKY